MKKWSTCSEDFFYDTFFTISCVLRRLFYCVLLVSQLFVSPTFFNLSVRAHNERIIIILCSEYHSKEMSYIKLYQIAAECNFL